MRPPVLLALLLVLPACSDDGPPPSQAAAVRTPVPSPSAVPSAGPTPERPKPSPSPSTSAAPAGPVVVPAASGDVDGDGEPDEVRVDADLEVLLSGGGSVSAPLAADVPPEVRGVEDVDRDGRAEVFVRTGQGASTTFLTPYRYDGQVLAALTVDGSPASLGLGGSATHGDGFSCTAEGGLVVRSATSLDGETWSVTETAYDVVGAELRQTARVTVDDLPQDDPRVGQAYLADCRTVGDS